MLEKMFNADSVAVIGASRTEGKVGNSVLKNLVNDFDGDIVPINPNSEEIMGLKCYPDILDVPDNIDLAVIVIPARFVPETIDKCGRAGVKSVIVISAGFKEAGIEGAKLERESVETARKYGIRMLGPNCLGLIDTTSNLNASFASFMAHKGNIGLMSQSGAICTSTLDWADKNRVGFSKFISLGNKADLSENDFLQELCNDDSTAVIAAYLEGVKNGHEFIDIARRVTGVKPVVMVKSGRTSAGSRAVSSHTGTLAGSDEAYNAAFRQSGIIRADSLQEMLDYIRAFSSQPVPKGRNMAILTNAGGFGILTADACYNEGLSLASFDESTIRTLRENLPPNSNLYNPVDLLGDAGSDLYAFAIDVLLEDPHVDGIIILTSPQAMTEVDKVAEIVADKVKTSIKPILCSFVGGTQVSEGEKILNDYSIPNYPFPERAVASMRALSTYNNIRKQSYTKPPEITADKKTVKSVIDEASQSKRLSLGLESLDILRAYDIPTVKTKIVKNLKEAIKACKQIGYPVVMKIVSPDISHKTDVGGVRLNLKNADDVERAYHTMMADVYRYMPDADITGVQVQEMVSGGKEVIIGMNQDVQFGPLLMFGMGGIYVELLKDVSFNVAPINRDEAKHMISSIKTYPILAGIRGEKPYDINSVADTLIKISQLVNDFPQILELDINPLIVLPDNQGCVAMDLRLTLREEE
ncbi:acetate--CoA ligase alpha subunit [Methanohalobium sp.]|uniref:acetate--CoA ligase alpha subunit n=1 Tax=Methanohalobium sp. TaxID=2837493 RepID=UPI0025D4DF7D|nr:acetate--CoA ligase family protein [Methanohalobium sp.]